MRKKVRDVMVYYVTFASVLAIAANSLADGTHIGLRKIRSVTIQSGEICDPDDVSQDDRLVPLAVSSGRRSQKKHKNVIDSDAVETEDDQDLEAITLKDSSVEEVNGSPILEVIDTETAGDPGAADTCRGAASNSKKTSKHNGKEKIMLDDTSVEDGDDGAKPEQTRRSLKSSKKASVKTKNNQGSGEESAEIAVVEDEGNDDENKTPSTNEISDDKKASEELLNEKKVENDLAAETLLADDTSAQVSTSEKQDDQSNAGSAEVNDDDEATKHKNKSGTSKKADATGIETDGENRRHLVLYDDGHRMYAKKLGRGRVRSKKRSKNTNKNTNVNNIGDSSDIMRLGNSRRSAVRRSTGKKSRNENRNYNSNVNTVASKPARATKKGAVFKVVPVRRSFDPFNYNSAAANRNKNVNDNTNVNRNVIGRNARREPKRYILRDDDDDIIDPGSFKIHSRGIRFRGRNWKVSSKGLPRFLDTASNVGQVWTQPRQIDQRGSYGPY